MTKDSEIRIILDPAGLKKLSCTDKKMMLRAKKQP